MNVTADAVSPPKTSTSPPGSRGARMPHLPGLDGLRGLAVIGVLLFHGGFAWAEGGFLGVSTFFTLSGFLITNLLVREWDRSGAIALARFWTRRFRRLLPAALLTIGLVGLVWWRLGSAEQLGGLRADMWAAVAYVANWRFYTAGTSYADLFSAPSPLQHFWSLAIEEQFYLVFPLIVMGLMKVGGRRLLTGAVVAATAVSVGLQLWLGGNIDRVYYGTDARAAELLLGALLAIWWSGRQSPSSGRHALPGATRRAEARTTAAADLVGVVALGAVFWAWHATSQTSEQLARGGFGLYALATTAIIYAATRPGVVTRALSLAPLRWAGLVSYGLYLYHWPVFLVLDGDRTGLSTTPLFVLRMAVTVAIAVVSYFAVEMPVRKGTMIRTGRSALGAGLAGAMVVGACAFLVTLDPPESQIPFADAQIEDYAATVESVVPTQTPQSALPGRTAAPQTNTAAVGPARTVMILGDSGTVDATPGLSAAFQAAGTTTVVGGAYPGVGLTRAQFTWRSDWPTLVADTKPDLVIVMMGSWDLDWQAENGDDAYAAVVDEAVDVLTAGGAKVLWLSMLPGGKNPDRPPDRVYSQLPDRYPGVVAYHDIESALRVPEGAIGVDALKGSEAWPRAYVAPDGATVLLRKPDHWHLCPPGAARLAAEINQAAAALGWAPLAPADWATGEWRSDPVYNDPPGGCDIQ